MKADRAAEIDAGDVRAEQARGESPVLLDVRDEDEVTAWPLPGSVHIPLPNLDQTQAQRVAGRDVITVCRTGNRSLTAAERLSAWGIRARSMRGGMVAWSQVFDVASIALGGGVKVVQFRRLGKGCLSYLVIAGGEAAVIDPSWHWEQYVRAAKERGAAIRAVMDTHLHADHISGARRLAQDTRARLYLGSHEAFEFKGWTRIADGDAVPVGSIHLAALAAPGHTPGSLLWRIDDSALFTGDVLFLSAVGRPDLHGSIETAARHLYKSLRRIALLPAEMLVLPGHAPEDDNAAPGTPHTRSLGAVLYGFSGLLNEEDTFVARASRVPPPPPNASKILQANRRGKPIHDEDAVTLEAGPNRCAAQA